MIGKIKQVRPHRRRAGGPPQHNLGPPDEGRGREKAAIQGGIELGHRREANR